MKFSDIKQFRWLDAFLMVTLPALAAMLIKLLLISCRVVKMEGMERQDEALGRSGGGAVYVTWHQ